MSIMLTSALALSIKRQNDIPMCEKGDFAEQSGPYSSGKCLIRTNPALFRWQRDTRLTRLRIVVSQCLDKCYMTEQNGERVGQICKGHCTSVPIMGGLVSVGCFNTDR